jgi:hypothetical protein
VFRRRWKDGDFVSTGHATPGTIIFPIASADTSLLWSAKIISRLERLAFLRLKTGQFREGATMNRDIWFLFQMPNAKNVAFNLA